MKKKTLVLLFLICLSITCFAEEKLQTFVSGSYRVYAIDEGLLFTSYSEDDIIFTNEKLIIDQYGWKRIISNDLPFGYFDYDTRTSLSHQLIFYTRK